MHKKHYEHNKAGSPYQKRQGVQLFRVRIKSSEKNRGIAEHMNQNKKDHYLTGNGHEHFLAY
jgi:hypothetical protein